MTTYIKNIDRRVILFMSGLTFTIIFSFLFTPAINSGDSPEYVKYALKFLGDDIPDNFSHRSPLYSLFLAIIIKIFGYVAFPGVTITLQFILIYITAIIIYYIFYWIIGKIWPALIISLLSYFNLATIHYGYSILTEILALFLFTLSVFCLFRYFQSRRTVPLVMTGILISFLFLARFNTIPLILSYLFLILIDILIRRNIKSGFLKITFFLIGPVVLLNSLAFYNFIKDGSYYLFPNGGSRLISRNAIIASIKGDEKVTLQYKPVLDLFLIAKRKTDQESVPGKKGTLLKLDVAGISLTLYSGYRIYKTAYNDLCIYYRLDPRNAEKALSKNLSMFYKEIYQQNKAQIFKLRVYSFLNSFRSSSGISSSAGEENLSKLPGWSIVIYKLGYLGISFTTFVFSIIYIISIINKRTPFNHYMTALIVLCYSYYLINFAYGTMGDANRFKFPSEPLMAGLFVYFIQRVYLRTKNRRESERSYLIS